MGQINESLSQIVQNYNSDDKTNQHSHKDIVYGRVDRLTDRMWSNKDPILDSAGSNTASISCTPQPAQYAQ